MSCMQVHMFYRQKNNLTEAINPGIAKAMLCERWGYSLWLGSFDQTLFLATEGPDTEHNRVTIDLASWNGYGWDANCGVVANFVPELVPANKVCNMADCAAGLRAAKRLAVEAGLAEEAGPLGIRTPPASTGPLDDPEFQRLLVLADRTLGMDSLPRSPDLLGSDSLFSADRILTRVAGRPTLAVVGQWRGGPAVDSEPLGAAVGLWQAAGDKLSLVASFHLKPAMGVVRSVYVTR
jgi:hypothetical protein